MSKHKLILSSNSGLYSARLGAPRFSILEAVDFLADVGFEAIDVNFPGTILSGEFIHEPVLDGPDWREEIARIRARAQERGLKILHSHAPYSYLYWDRESPEYAMGLEMTRRSIEATALLGGRHIVVHPFMNPERSETLMEESLRDLAPLAEYASGFGVRLAVENMRCTPAETLAELADRIGADVCWDAGHANILGLDQEKSLAALGARVKVLHIHDNYGSMGKPLASKGPSQTDLHQPPFIGNICWDSFLRGLRQIGFQGAFNYEVPGKMLPDGLREAFARYLVAAGEELLGRL